MRVGRKKYPEGHALERDSRQGGFVLSNSSSIQQDTHTERSVQGVAIWRVISKDARPDHPAPSTAIRLPEHLCNTAELHAKKNDIGDKHKAVRRYQRRMDSAVVRKSENYCNCQKDGE